MFPKYCLLFAIAHLFCQPLSAADIADYLEPTTCAVARINLTELDLVASTALIQQLAPDAVSPQTVTAFRVFSDGIVGSLKSAGVTDVYVTLSTIELSRGKVAVIVPSENPQLASETLQAVAGMLPAAWGFSIHQHAGVVVLGTEAHWQRISNADRPVGSPLRNAVVDGVKSTVTLTIGIADTLRSTVADVWPDQLPETTHVPLPPSQLMRDIRTIQLAIESPSKLRLSAFIQCSDPTAAERTSKIVKSLLATLNTQAILVQTEESNIVLSSEGDELVQLVRKATTGWRTRATGMQASNNLKQVMLAIHGFHDKYRSFPPRMTVSTDGKPLLSWRVFVLPFLGEEKLYREFRLDEAWDSPHNRQLIGRMPDVFAPQKTVDFQPGHTCIQAPLMTASAWHGEEDRMLEVRDIVDGTSNTICFTQTPPSAAVIWSEPKDLVLGDSNLVEDLFGDREAAPFAFFDGSVRLLPQATPVTTLKATLTRAGSEIIPR